MAEGRCDGRISGRLVGANHPRQRSDGTFEADFQGVIETDDNAVIYFDLQGYGTTHPIGRRQIVGAVTHLSDAVGYQWLNDSIAVSAGEVRASESKTELVIDVAELVWEELDDLESLERPVNDVALAAMRAARRVDGSGPGSDQTNAPN